MKYRVARIMAKYPSTQAGYAQFVNDPELKALGFTGDGKGNIIAGTTRDGVTAGDKIDVMGGYQAGGKNWWWGAPGPVAATPPPTTLGSTMTTKPISAGQAPTFPNNPNLGPDQSQPLATSQYSTPLATSMSTTLGTTGTTGTQASQGSVSSNGVAPTAGTQSANTLPLKDLMATYARMNTPTGQTMLVPKSQQARYTALGGRYL
jgi:hypothetical protein